MPGEPPVLRPGPPEREKPRLDAVDLAIVDALVLDGRLSNAALARRVGIPETTCAGRVRLLRERGVITGFQARVDLATLGRPVQAFVSVRLAGQDRQRVLAFGDEVAALPEVLAAYNVAGADDFVVHVAAASTTAVRDFVLDELSSRSGVVHVETAFIFSTHSGLPAAASPR